MGTYHGGASTGGTSVPSSPMTCGTTRSGTSLRASAAGPMPSASQGGPTICRSGPALAPASRSPMPGGTGASRTPGTCGPIGSGSSASAALQQSLENRLRRRLSTDGSTWYSMTWKKKDTPAQRRFSLLRASARRTSVTESSGSQAGWTTPVTGDAKNQTPRPHCEKHVMLADQLAGWATPNTMDSMESRKLEERKKKGGCCNLKDQLAGWSTPTVQDGTQTGVNEREAERNPKTFWAQVTGLRCDGSPAGTGSNARFRLNPRFSLWLMGYPTGWASCGERATPSSRRSQRSS